MWQRWWSQLSCIRASFFFGGGGIKHSHYRILFLTAVHRLFSWLFQPLFFFLMTISGASDDNERRWKAWVMMCHFQENPTYHPTPNPCTLDPSIPLLSACPGSGPWFCPCPGHRSRYPWEYTALPGKDKFNWPVGVWNVLSPGLDQTRKLKLPRIPRSARRQGYFDSLCWYL